MAEIEEEQEIDEHLRGPLSNKQGNASNSIILSCYVAVMIRTCMREVLMKGSLRYKTKKIAK